MENEKVILMFFEYKNEILKQKVVSFSSTSGPKILLLSLQFEKYSFSKFLRLIFKCRI